ncbi:hypothetical protein B0E55_06413 [Rhodococcus sp. 66b]|nr:hypothetical protein B0E55_06413 [Rhodococcus sp. 66b]
MSAAAAECGCADAAAAALQFEGEVQGDAGAGHAEGVSDGDGAAVDVDLGGVEAEFAGGGDPDGGERFVDFDEVEVGGVDAFLGAGLGDGAGGLGLEGGVGSGDDAVGADFRDPGQAEFFGFGFAHHDHGGGAVGDRGGGAGGDGAVLAERGTQFAEGFGGGVGADAFVLCEDDGLAFALGDGDGDYFVVEVAVFPGAGRVLV